MKSTEWLQIFIASCLLAVLAMAPAAAAAGTGQGQGSADAPATQKAQDLQLEGDGPWVVRVLTVDREALGALAQWADIWSVHKKKGYTLVQVDRADVDRLLAEGFKVKLDKKRTELLQRELRRAQGGVPPPDQAGLELRNQTTGIPGYPCYRTVEETFATAAAIAAAHPNLATWIDVGDSWQKTQTPTAGYDMKVLRLTNSALPGPKPILFVNCAIHAREYTTAELCTRFAERLVAGYGVDPDATWLLDDQEVHLLLQTNPDGRKRAETGLSWRKNVNNNYCSNTNSRGADLNRNFDFEWGCCGGSSSFACSETYRGPSPASEPEIQALEAYVTSIFPDQRPDDLTTPAPDDATGVAIDIHSHGQLVLWPWGFDTSPAPNGTQLQTLGRKLAYFNGHDPEQGIDLYPTDGTSDSFYYGRLGVAAYGYELGTQFFETCTYFRFNILEQNIASLLYAAKVARTPYLTAAGPESLDVVVPPRAVEPGELVVVSATLDDTRYSTANGIEPSQAIAAAELYVDLPPWAPGAAPITMSASDGLFDETVEGVAATLDTTGFTPGRYTLYVRGQDAAGNWGSVSAVFLHVVDPVTAPTLQGTVRDADSLAPLAATVRAGDFETTTDGNGAYSMRLPAGTYDVTVVATGYQSATAEGVVAVDSQTTTQDFDLPPFAGLWTDDAEAGNPGWTAGSPWAITTEHAFSPTHAWSDSPGTLYANNADVSLTSPVLDLQDYTGTTLSFRHRYELEQGYDFGHVEVSTDGGTNWTEVAVYTGEQTASWALAEIPLPALDGQAQVRLRFRLESDDSVREDGWFVDDVLLRAVFDVQPECTTDPECDDGLYCNGVETCNAGTCEAGTPVDCSDGVSCTVDTCNEATDSCDSTPSDALCDDGLFCDGTETCDAVLGCQAGTPVDCADGVDCTADSCNEATDSCDHLPDDGFCADGVFCNGSEVCDPLLGCQPGGDPCPGLLCDETGDVCVECFVDGDCDDGLFCNGTETCGGGACQAGSDPCPGMGCDEVGDTCVAAPTAQLEWGTVSVGGTAVTVPLTKVYTSPVVVTAVQYHDNSVPVVTRISNVTPTSFDLRLQNPAGGSVVAESVSYLVVEEGVWTVGGVKVEAWTYTSTVTDENNSWLGEDQTYGQSYTDPVVLGQVMSTNDPGWSVFWDRGSTRQLPPTATELGTGKHVAEDTDVSRADETVGVVVFESGHGTLGGVEYEAALGPDSVRGVDNSPPYPYTFVTAFATAPTVALVSQAGMQSSEGSWAQVHGATVATTTTLYLSVDEDQIGRAERRHSTERVGYVAFAAPGVYP